MYLSMMSNILMNELSLDLQRVFVSNRSSRNYDVLIKNTDSIEKVIIYDWELIVGAFFKKQRNMVIYRLTSPCIIVCGWPLVASHNILMKEENCWPSVTTQRSAKLSISWEYHIDSNLCKLSLIHIWRCRRRG